MAAALFRCNLATGVAPCSHCRPFSFPFPSFLFLPDPDVFFLNMRLLSLPLRRAAVVSACRVTAGNAGAARGAASASAARAMTSLATARASKQHHHHQRRRRMATTAAVPDSMVLNGKPALTTTAFRTHTCGELRSVLTHCAVCECSFCFG